MKKKSQRTAAVLDESKFAPGSMGCHEALHMANVLAGLVYEELVDHPAIRMQDEWRAKAETAADALADLYQMIGAAHL